MTCHASPPFFYLLKNLPIKSELFILYITSVVSRKFVDLNLCPKTLDNYFGIDPETPVQIVGADPCVCPRAHTRVRPYGICNLISGTRY